MKNAYSILPLILLSLLFHACAPYKAQYLDEEDKEVKLPNKAIDKTFYLIGDAGISPEGGISKGLTAFSNHITNKNTENDYTIFLGDNIYPAGLPKEGDEKRAQAENALNAQIQSVKNFNGEVLFIPGNHDW